ncbi:uncharacterized protein LOC128132298 [Lactuca sativa]|uniref:uncharacterized protein LOC128132298 n=1 Tax=Lactuca sativa TaxID=4236 RepID=UPI0022AF62A5|nr:uncharacterized protein LOC128132298 [Lactuca sativa]
MKECKSEDPNKSTIFDEEFDVEKDLIEIEGLLEEAEFEELMKQSDKSTHRILVAVDYVSKWAEAQALPTNDGRVVVRFLKKLFSRFGVPKALISDRGTHFANDQLEKVLRKYGVTHKFSTSYHPQTSGQNEVTNRALKRILERSVGINRKEWSD